jgi:2-polyprenyl-3-methyl-5-hydroxy-6-metoxy-1,4-benzoquinol methylase
MAEAAAFGRCILCGCSDVQPVESIKVKDLALLWQRALAADIVAEFGGCEKIKLAICAACGLKFYVPTIAGSESFYEICQRRSALYYEDDKSEYSFACRFVRPGSDVLEVGSGKGAFAGRITPRSYLGLELSREAVRMAGERGVRVLNELVEDHAHTHPGYYDVVCTFQVLEHVPHPDTFLGACVECLKPSGVLIFGVPAEDSFIGLLRNSYWSMPPHHVSRWTDDCIRHLAALFPLKLMELAHEPMADRFRSEYAKAIAVSALNKIVGRSPGLLDLSVSSRVIQKLGGLASRFMLRGLSDPRMLPAGHTVMAAFQRL